MLAYVTMSLATVCPDAQLAYQSVGCCSPETATAFVPPTDDHIFIRAPDANVACPAAAEEMNDLLVWPPQQATVENGFLEGAEVFFKLEEQLGDAAPLTMQNMTDNAAMHNAANGATTTSGVWYAEKTDLTQRVYARGTNWCGSNRNFNKWATSMCPELPMDVKSTFPASLYHHLDADTFSTIANATRRENCRKLFDFFNAYGIMQSLEAANYVTANANKPGVIGTKYIDNILWGTNVPSVLTTKYHLKTPLMPTLLHNIVTLLEDTTNEIAEADRYGTTWYTSVNYWHMQQSYFNAPFTGGVAGGWVSHPSDAQKRVDVGFYYPNFAGWMKNTKLSIDAGAFGTALCSNNMMTTLRDSHYIHAVHKSIVEDKTETCDVLMGPKRYLWLNAQIAFDQLWVAMRMPQYGWGASRRFISISASAADAEAALQPIFLDYQKKLCELLVDLQAACPDSKALGALGSTDSDDRFNGCSKVGIDLLS